MDIAASGGVVRACVEGEARGPERKAELVALLRRAIYKKAVTFWIPDKIDLIR
jgi:hypothetical protein